MKIRKHICIFLALLLLDPNVGLALNVHYCGENIASVSLENFYQSNNLEIDCCGKEIKKSACCNDKKIKIEKKSDNSIVKIFSFEVQQPFNIAEWKSIQVSNLSNSTIDNNVINYNLNELLGCSSRNNIFTLGFFVGSRGCTGCVSTSFEYNTFCGSGTPSDVADIGNGGTNTTAIAYNSLFVSTDPFNQHIDRLFQLSSGSIARTAGLNGGQCGIFGGSSPYVLAGQPSVPIITQFDAGSSANSGSPLQVTLTIKANN